jgi:hypothetical protein
VDAAARGVRVALVLPRSGPGAGAAGHGAAAAGCRRGPERPHRPSPGWSPLRCATASASTGTGNEAIIRLLLDHGAIAEDSDLCLAGFSNDDQCCLRLLLARAPAAAAGAELALAAPVGKTSKGHA